MCLGQHDLIPKHEIIRRNDLFVHVNGEYISRFTCHRIHIFDVVGCRFLAVPHVFSKLHREDRSTKGTQC